MQEPDVESVANCHGPESAAPDDGREVSLAAGDAQAGRLSSEIINSMLPVPLLDGSAKRPAPLARGVGRAGGVEGPMRTRMPHVREPGESGVRPCA